MYAPRIVPREGLSEWLTQELANIARAMNERNPTLNLSVSYAAPAKVFDGMIVLADGTKWNPGSGAGFYGYRAGAWHLLG